MPTYTIPSGAGQWSVVKVLTAHVPGTSSMPYTRPRKALVQIFVFVAKQYQSEQCFFSRQSPQTALLYTAENGRERR